jgi:ZIP family zinc transporter
MVALSFLDLLPEGLALAPLWIVGLSFFLGIGVFEVLDHVLPHIHPELLKKDDKSVRRSVQTLIRGICLHNLPEGLAIGVGFAVEPSMGILIAVAIALHDIPENIATIFPLYCLNKNRCRSFIIVMVTVLFELFGFLVGYFILHDASIILLGSSLAMAAGLMTYIAFDELIPAAQIRKYPKRGIISLVLGVLTVLAIIAFLH